MTLGELTSKVKIKAPTTTTPKRTTSVTLYNVADFSCLSYTDL